MKSASLWYSGNYELDLSEEELEAFGYSSFRTHRHQVAQWLHQASHFFLRPFAYSLQWTIRALQPRPGEDKDEYSITQKWPFLIARILIGIIFLAISSVFSLVSFPFHLAALFAYASRPVLGYIRFERDFVSPLSFPILEEDKPLTVCSYNVALMFSTVCIGNDIRQPKKRALEVTDDILDNAKEDSADILCFQEAFHQGATQLMLEKLKITYPYIVYNVAPTSLGIGSGLIIASKYPIQSARFLCFENSVGEDGLAPKGVLRCSIEVAEKQSLFIYNTHLQAQPGFKESKVRLQQMQQIQEFMAKDKKNNPQIHQLLVGDLNTSKISAWGESNERMDINQPEKSILDHIKREYDEPYYNDHHSNGERLEGTMPYFLPKDRQRIRGKVVEPMGTWYFGPHSNKSTLLNTIILNNFEKMEKEQNFKLFSQGCFDKPVSWGTRQWNSERPVSGALFDHVLIPKGSQLDAKVEIRHTKLDSKAQSGSSDHLPIYARFFKKKTVVRDRDIAPEARYFL